MPHDVVELFCSLWASATVVSLALWVGVGLRPSALRTWNIGLLMQSLGWGLLTAAAADTVAAPLLRVAGVAALSASLGWMHRAAASFCGRRVPWALLLLPPAACATVFATAFGSFMERLAIVDLVFGVQLLALARTVLPWAAGERTARWRWLGAGALALAGAIAVAPLALRAAAPGWAAGGAAAVLVTNNMWPLVDVFCTMAILLAHRDEAEQELRRQATIDGLTGLLNRTAALRLGRERLATATRDGAPASVVLLDLDHFKRINDSRGHPAGDAALACFGRLLAAAAPPDDVAGRYGGEEFCLVLRADVPAAQALVERLRRRLATECATSLGFAVTFSAGAASATPPAPCVLEHLIAAADAALYAAKREGRDRLVIACRAADREADVGRVDAVATA